MSVWAMQPLSAYGRVLGVLAAWDGPDRHPASPEWERGMGTPRKFVRAFGSAGSGRGLVKVQTVNGDIEIRLAM